MGPPRTRRRAAQAAAEARDKFNSNLIDRISTVVQPSPPLRIVYGSSIVGGDVVAIFTSNKYGVQADGTPYTHVDGLKHLVVVYACHQIQAVKDVLIAGIRCGKTDANGWVLPTATGTGTGYVLGQNATAGAESFLLAQGTGTILAGDEISFAGDLTRYPVTVGITGPGQMVTVGIGLSALTISGTVVSLGNEFATAAPTSYSVQINAGQSITLLEPCVQILSSTDATTVTLGTEITAVNVTVSADGKTITNPTTTDATVAYLVNHVTQFVRVSHHLGTTTQTVDTYLSSLFPIQWDSSHVLSGLAYSVITLDLEEQRFQGGPPQISFDVDGALLLDPRTGRKEFYNSVTPSAPAPGRNNALVINDFLLAPWGFNCKQLDVDQTYLISAANACDVSNTFTSIDASGATITTVEPLYTANGALTTADQPEATLNNLANSFAGTVSYGGAWLIVPGVWTPSFMTLDFARQLPQRLEERAKVDRAVAMLTTLHGWSAKQARERLAVAAAKAGLPPGTVAETVLAVYDTM